MTEITNKTPQPGGLEQFYRQPSIYITLPSKGKWYDDTVLTPSETGEYPVYPMTANIKLFRHTIAKRSLSISKASSLIAARCSPADALRETAALTRSPPRICVLGRPYLSQ